MDEAETFEQYAMQQMEQQIKEMTEDANRILQKNVRQELYEKYTPVAYKRTGDLINSIASSFNMLQGRIFFNAGKLKYKSIVSGEDVSKYVPYWLDYTGHHDRTGIDNMYHNYNARGFLEKTVQELEEKYGKDCVDIVGKPIY